MYDYVRVSHPYAHCINRLVVGRTSMQTLVGKICALISGRQYTGGILPETQFLSILLVSNQLRMYFTYLNQFCDCNINLLIMETYSVSRIHVVMYSILHSVKAGRLYVSSSQALLRTSFQSATGSLNTSSPHFGEF